MKLPKHAEGRKDGEFYGAKRRANCNFCNNPTAWRLMVPRGMDDLYSMVLCQDCYYRGHR